MCRIEKNKCATMFHEYFLVRIRLLSLYFQRLHLDLEGALPISIRDETVICKHREELDNTKKKLQFWTCPRLSPSLILQLGVASGISDQCF
mmetsp:Transcript_24353/g.57867  ORF Transcript_24353/g.57867 Transcript_24353/m.57867 type:complete len:91 (-) Transcript_24353:115-387(-)